MPHYKTITRTVIDALDKRLEDAEWNESDIDDEPTIQGDVGQVAMTIYTEREPVEWDVVILCMDDAVGMGHFEDSGESLSISSAKIDAMMAVPALVDKTIRYIVGEFSLRGGPSNFDTPIRPTTVT